MQVLVYSMLNSRPAEREFYNALPEADPTLFPDDDQPKMEEEADPVKEAKKLVEKAKAASIWFLTMRRAWPRTKALERPSLPAAVRFPCLIFMISGRGWRGSRGMLRAFSRVGSCFRRVS